MKILMVSMNSIHFIKWVNQLKDAGFDVYWFDINGGGVKSDSINWVHQIVDWKMKWNFPGRVFMKKHFGKLYNFIQKINNRNTALEFKKVLHRIQPDIVHSFAVNIAGLPILSCMKSNDIKWLVSTWGSDIYYYKKLGIKENEIRALFERINFCITDCLRDKQNSFDLGFKGKFLGVFPGNGGIHFPISIENLKSISDRKIILIKGYKNNIGRADIIIEAFDKSLEEDISSYEVVIVGAPKSFKNFIQNKFKDSKFKLTIFTNDVPIDNGRLLNIMNESYLFIANSVSDGMPNMLIEAMGMGCLPIHSNPGGVINEVIENKKNGIVICNPLDANEINLAIKEALCSRELALNSFEYNVGYIRNNYDRQKLKNKIIGNYHEALSS